MGRRSNKRWASKRNWCACGRASLFGRCVMMKITGPYQNDFITCQDIVSCLCISSKSISMSITDNPWQSSSITHRKSCSAGQIQAWFKLILSAWALKLNHVTVMHWSQGYRCEKFSVWCLTNESIPRAQTAQRASRSRVPFRGNARFEMEHLDKKFACFLWNIIFDTSAFIADILWYRRICSSYMHEGKKTEQKYAIGWDCWYLYNRKAR